MHASTTGLLTPKDTAQRSTIHTKVSNGFSNHWFQSINTNSTWPKQKSMSPNSISQSLSSIMTTSCRRNLMPFHWLWNSLICKRSSRDFCHFYRKHWFWPINNEKFFYLGILLRCSKILQLFRTEALVKNFINIHKLITFLLQSTGKSMLMTTKSQMP